MEIILSHNLKIGDKIKHLETSEEEFIVFDIIKEKQCLILDMIKGNPNSYLRLTDKYYRFDFSSSWIKLN